MGHNYALEPALDVKNPYRISKGIYDVKNKYYKSVGGLSQVHYNLTTTLVVDPYIF
jgi:hypothetical protein